MIFATLSKLWSSLFERIDNGTPTGAIPAQTTPTAPTSPITKSCKPTPVTKPRKLTLYDDRFSILELAKAGDGQNPKTPGNNDESFATAAKDQYCEVTTLHKYNLVKHEKKY